MQAFIESGAIVDLILVLMAVEIVALNLWRRRSGRGIPTLQLLANIGAGGSILVALRFALTQSDWRLGAAALIASLVFHCADLACRWPRDHGAASPSSG